MSEFAANGAVSYRTKRMETAAAWRFATCLKANSRFTDVAMVHSDRAKGAARYFVTYRPSNPERVADKDGGRPFHWCVSVASGGVYQTTPSSCTCPDEQYRAVPGGCKHQRSLRLLLEAGQ